MKKDTKIVESLISESEDTLPVDTPQTLEELDAVFLDMQRAVQQNLYFFSHYTQLSHTSPEIYKKQSTRYRELLQKLRDGVSNLHAGGFLRDELFAGEYNHAIDTLTISTIYWTPFSELKKSIDMDCVEYRRHAWSTVYYFLTEKGRIELQNLIQL